MPPKKQTASDSQEQIQEDIAQEVLESENDLRREIFELRRRLTLVQIEKEKSDQENSQGRAILIRQYQEQINRINGEKDDEIRNLMHANQQYRDMAEGQTPRKGHDIPMPRQILYDGKGSWESFVKPFTALVESCKWNQEECLFRLQSSLRGEAAEYVFNQTTAETLTSYRKLMEALESRYKERRTASSYLAELENRRLQPKGKLAEYVSDIRKLVLKGYPTADQKTRETINVRHFIKGLLDQQAALHIGMKDPVTIDEARTILETYNSLKDEVKIGRLREVQAENNPNTEFVTERRLKSFGQEIKSSLGKKIDNLANRIKETSRKQEVKSTKTVNAQGKMQVSEIICYRCGEIGHFARSCAAKEDKRSDNKQGN